MPQKIILEKIFDQKITDRVKTFRDACDILCVDQDDVLPYKYPKYDFEKSANAFVKLIFIVKALNEGWKPNWDDKNEYKYYPYFEMAGSGFRFSYYYCTDTYTNTGAGVRLVFKTKTLAEYAGEQFIDLYKEYLV